MSRREDFRERLQFPAPEKGGDWQRSAKVGDIPLSLPSKRVLAYTAEEAHLLKSKRIDTEHLLLGLLREPESNVPNLLAAAGIDLQSARQRISDNLASEPAFKTAFKPAAVFVLLVLVLVATYLIVRLISR